MSGLVDMRGRPLRADEAPPVEALRPTGNQWVDVTTPEWLWLMRSQGELDGRLYRHGRTGATVVSSVCFIPPDEGGHGLEYRWLARDHVSFEVTTGGAS